MIKEIIVVAPKEYASLARKLSDAISKKAGCIGTFWSINRYEINKIQLSSSHYVFFVGNTEENKYAKRFLSSITNLKNQFGACYGYDGTNALVFGEGKFENALEMQELFKKYEKVLIKINRLLHNPFIKWFPLGVTKVTRTAFFKFQFRLLQTDAASAFFLEECFDQWVSGN